MMLILRDAGETLKDYKIRLFRNKDKYGLSNQDIAELINQASSSNKDESVYRKWYSAYNEGYEDALQHSKDNSAMSQILIEKKIELEREKKKAQTERIETNKWIREQAREEMFYDKLEDSISANMSYNPQIKYIPTTNDKEKDAVLFLSDQHYGVDFVIYGVNNEILNQYSPEIFEERMKLIFNDTINQIKKNNVNELNIISLGDTLDGMLRNSQLIKLRWGVIDCAVKYANYMFKWLTELSKYVRINFYNTSGNHTEMRLLDGKKGEHERENIDKVIISIIKNGVELTGNNNINIIENKSGFVYTKLNCGYSIFGFHGESNNLEKAVKDFSEVYNIDIDYIAAGHLHHNNINLFGSRKGAIRVGSIIGCDDYSLKLRKRTDATSTFCIFEKNYGLTDIHINVLN